MLTLLRAILSIAELSVIAGWAKKLPRKKRVRRKRGCMTFYVNRK